MDEEKEPREITISMTGRDFILELALKDADLIETIFSALTEYVDKGFPIKVRQTYMTSPSDSVKIISKIISKREKMDEWKEEVKQLISVLRKKE